MVMFDLTGMVGEHIPENHTYKYFSGSVQIAYIYQ